MTSPSPWAGRRLRRSGPRATARNREDLLPATPQWLVQLACDRQEFLRSTRSVQTTCPSGDETAAPSRWYRGRYWRYSVPVHVAAVAIECKVIEGRRPTVLPSNDVIYGKRVKGIGLLRDSTILATVVRSFLDLVTQGLVHQADPLSLRSLRAFDCRTAMNVPADTNDAYSACSSLVSLPASDFSASSSMRAWTVGEARNSTSCFADSGVRQRPTGSRSSFRTVVSVLMSILYYRSHPAIQPTR